MIKPGGTWPSQPKAILPRLALAFLLAGCWLATPTAQADDDAGTPPAKAFQKLIIAPRTIELSPALQHQLGIVAQAPTAATSAPYVHGWGVLQANPAESFVLRAPYSGVLHRANGHWPTLAGKVKAAHPLANIAPLLTLTALVTLQVQLATARSQAAAAAAMVRADTAAFHRLKALNRQDQTVSIAKVQQAQARMAGDKANLAAAKASITLITAAIQGSPAGQIPLAAARSGTVVSLSARPGESVTQGQTICRVESFRHLIASIVLPGAVVPLHHGAAAWITISGLSKPIVGKVLARAPHADSQTGLPIEWVALTGTSGQLRPGLKCTALLQTAAAPQKGWLVPASAVVWHNGRRWFYTVQGNTFARKALRAVRQPDGSYFAVDGLNSHSHIVINGAELLFSIEQRGKIKPSG